MDECTQRQKVVKRDNSGSLTRYRCLNKQSGVYSQEVDEDICSRCPVRELIHQRPCKDYVKQVRNEDQSAAIQDHVTTKEMVDVTDEEFYEMIKAAGIDPAEVQMAEPIAANTLPPKYPPLSVQAWTYKEALIRWSKAGRPTRSEDEVERLHKICAGDPDNHLPPCEWYDPEQKRCKGCGCRVTVGAIAVFNKLKMATEHCPKEKF